MPANEKITERKWPLAGYAPGGYTCKCRQCGREFIGDKRASNCLPCAEALTSQAADAVPVEGWVMVPVEPTREMWAAMADTLYGYKNRHHDKVAGDLYRAAVSARHASPSKSELAEARRLALEEAAAYHDEKAAFFRSEIAAIVGAGGWTCNGREESAYAHEQSAKAIRALANIGEE
jgi:hypothetical protein